ncbi:MAG TPA: YsnF/AvaK domain-containing protein [Ktedonobacteraceae bacterium]|nr:YsnF/AvaK domain-containing protein [Ktedonobacteraceae bacterium]
MMITERSVVVGVFQEDRQVEQAIHDLQLAGFRDDQIRFSVRGDATNIFDGLMQMGVSQSEANYYNQEFADGHTIVVVLTNDQQQEATNILQQNNAYNAHIIHERANNQIIQVREETLQTFKQWVQTGEVRIRKRVVTENKTFTVPVTREEVIIERYPHPSNGQMESPTIPTPEEDIQDIAGSESTVVPLAVGETMTILVREEQVHFEKVPMVVEEILLTKRIIQEMRTIHETVQKEQVQIEPIGNARIHDNREGDIADT